MNSYRICYKTDWSNDKVMSTTVSADSAEDAANLIKFWHPCASEIDIMLMTDKQTERYMPK